jgi:hypothetical protein
MGLIELTKSCPENTYMLEELDSVKLLVAINDQNLKKYFPSMWDDRQ